MALHDDAIELTATWREEWVVNPERRYTHGGILAALIDLAADWAMVKKLGRPVPTVDCASTIMPPLCRATSPARARWSARAASSRPGRRRCSTRAEARRTGRGTYYTGRPAPEGVGRLLGWPSFTNLGDLIAATATSTKIAVIDLGGETAPREFSYAGSTPWRTA